MLSANVNMDIISAFLPTLAKDISNNVIRKYTKFGIYEPNTTDKSYIKQLQNNDCKVLAVIDSNMFYKDKKLNLTNYIYISPEFSPILTERGLNIQALVFNKTWNIQCEGIICVDEINGNLVRVS